MAANAKGAIALTEAQFVTELTKRLNSTRDEDKQLPRGTVHEFVKAFKAEAEDCVVNGYKVTLTGLLRLEPRYVPEKPKGVMVRNPSTGVEAPRDKTIPPSFAAKAFASPAIKKQFPTTKTKAGQALAEQLAPAPKKKAAAKGAKVKA